jgi:hypothetical protein
VFLLSLEKSSAHGLVQKYRFTFCSQQMRVHISILKDYYMSSSSSSSCHGFGPLVPSCLTHPEVFSFVSPVSFCLWSVDFLLSSVIYRE